MISSAPAKPPPGDVQDLRPHPGSRVLGPAVVAGERIIPHPPLTGEPSPEAPPTVPKVLRPDRIAAARRSAGFTQSDLAALLGVTQQHVSMIENRPGWPCSRKVARDLTRRLNLDPSVFADDQGRRAERVMA